jgi:putative tryptophan/tyrosine transport system substrate-binding protein
MRRRQFITLLGGAAAGWSPATARAQQPGRMRRLVVVMASTEGDSEGQAWVISFREALAKLGWIDGRNVRIEYRWDAINPQLGRAYASELAGLMPDIVFVDTAPAATAIREQLRTVPIVFIQAGDPVQANLVESFARPGGNFTGFLSYERTIIPKLLQLLKDIAPNVNRVAVMQFENSTWRGDFAAIETIAPSFAVRPISAIVHDDGEIERAMMSLAREPDSGLILPPDANSVLHRDAIVALAAEHHLPAVYSNRAFAVGGGLLSYGVERTDLYKRAAGYVDRILRGEKPADLPVQAPTKFELVVNLKTAKALGLTVSNQMQLLADEVIE